MVPGCVYPVNYFLTNEETVVVPINVFILHGDRVAACEVV